MLTEPAEGIPPVVETPEALAAVVAAFGAGTGPVAVDAERASGYRYGQRTYLVQLRREGAGHRADRPDRRCPTCPRCPRRSSASSGCCTRRPRTCPVSPSRACCPAACLRHRARRPAARAWSGSGSRPSSPTRSASGWPRSTPRSTGPPARCPREWLRYAALDVEVLVELREVLAERLAVAGKAEWARAGVRGRPHRAAAAPARRAVAPGLRPARDPRRPPARRRPRALADPRPERPAARHLPRPRAAGRTRSSRPRRRCPARSPSSRALPAFSGKGTRRRAPLWQAGDRPRPGRARQRPALGPRTEERRAAAAARLGREGPRRRRPARRRPRGHRGALRAVVRPGGEPAAARPAAPAVLDAARRAGRSTGSARSSARAAPARGRSSSSHRGSPRRSRPSEPPRYSLGSLRRRTDPGTRGIVYWSRARTSRCPPDTVVPPWRP